MMGLKAGALNTSQVYQVHFQINPNSGAGDPDKKP